jgi:hypothetical protein
MVVSRRLAVVVSHQLTVVVSADSVVSSWLTVVVSRRRTVGGLKVQYYPSCVEFAISTKCVEMTPHMCQKYFFDTIPAVVRIWKVR